MQITIEIDQIEPLIEAKVQEKVSSIFQRLLEATAPKKKERVKKQIPLPRSRGPYKMRTAAEKAEIYEAVKSGMKPGEIVKKYNITPSHLYKIRTGKIDWSKFKKSSKLGKHHRYNHLLSAEQKAELKFLALHTNMTGTQIADLYGIDNSLVYQVKHNQIYKDVDPQPPADYDQPSVKDKYTRVQTPSSLQKLDDQQKAEVLWMVNNSTWKDQQIAKVYGVSASTIKLAREGRSYKSVKPSRPDWFDVNNEKRYLAV